MIKGRGLKIGVIGAGVMGKNHLRICASLPGVNLIGLADVNEVAGKQIAEQHGIAYFKQYADLFPLVDAIVLAAPTQAHFEIGKECLNAGKHLLIEKPIAASSAEGEQLVALAAEKKLIFAVGLIERFNPAFQELQKLLRHEKLIGLTLQRFSPFPERISDADVIQDMMIHDLDLLLALLPKDEIESIKAEGKKVKSKRLDQVDVTIFFKSGILAKVHANRVFAIKTRKIMALTESCLIEADLLEKRVYVRDLKGALPSAHHVKPVDQLTVELTDFIKAVKAQEAPTVDGLAGLKATKLAEEVSQLCY
ncbi:MAG: Gfo/Idh/MocA family oxidoreductase [Candidatus Margulisiibacteriota bacterium]